MAKQKNDLHEALKKVNKSADFFRNTSYQGSSTEKESVIASANYLCLNIKKEAEKEYYKNINIILTAIENTSLEKKEYIPTITGVKTLVNENKKIKIIENFPNLKQEIDDTYYNIEEIKNKIDEINWGSILASFKKCDDFLSEIKIDGKKISTKYEEYIKIVDKISKKI